LRSQIVFTIAPVYPVRDVPLIFASCAHASLPRCAGGGRLRRRAGPFRASDQKSALDRVQAEIRDRFERSASSLGAIATRVGRQSRRRSSATPRPAGIRRLSILSPPHCRKTAPGGPGVTVCDTAAAPLAWAGRVSDLPKARVQGPAAIFIAPSALGPRLIRVEPVTADGVRVSTVVAEQSLGMTEEAPGSSTRSSMHTSTSVTLRLGAAGARRDVAVPLHRARRDSAFVLEAEVAPADLAAARARWRSITWATMLCIVGAALLLSMGPLIDMRRRTREPAAFSRSPPHSSSSSSSSRVIVYFALTPSRRRLEPTPLDSFDDRDDGVVVWLGST